VPDKAEEMGDHKGTNSLNRVEDSDWFFVEEAECNDDVDNADTFDELFETSTNESNVSNLINDEEVEQGNSLELFNAQVTLESNCDVAALKRKYIKSPQQTVADLSPQLQAVRITPERVSKRRLFQDSGFEEDEAENLHAQVEGRHVIDQNGGDISLEVLQSSNRRAILLAKFKDWFGVSYNEITRAFRSDKSCTDHWIVVVFKAAVEVLESSKIILQQHCNYLQVNVFGFSALYLLNFKSGKSRETVHNLFVSLLNVQTLQLLADPPKCRSMPTALYFYKKTMLRECYVFGKTPDWITKQTLVNHQIASTAESFNFSEMVQWAYDNDYVEDCEIAYYYALHAETDANAEAYLKSNNQVNYVKNCSAMVRMYKRFEMKEMTMSEWIFKCCKKCEEQGDWKPIAQFLKFQQVNILAFLVALKQFLKGTPKKNCLLIHGPPDTGKSMFCYSLVTFLRGKVVSYVNRTSQFWLQPLRDGKIGMIDDATYVCWTYIDQNLRTALDGNAVSLDVKHKAPQQLKLPPLLVSSNVDVLADQSLKYLHSRIQSFKFPNKIPISENGTPLFTFTDATWKCFFEKLEKQLDLQRPEEENNGDSSRAFRCTARRDSETH